MFALESLSLNGETFESSERVQRACRFLISKQMDDGGWGETYMVRSFSAYSLHCLVKSEPFSNPSSDQSCVSGEYAQHEKSQVVQTSWAVIALIYAEYPYREPIERGVQLVISRQLPVSYPLLELFHN